MKPTTKQARKVINKFLKDSNAYHVGTWTDKTCKQGSTDRYLAYRVFNYKYRNVTLEATKFLNELWPGCAKVTCYDQYIRVKCTLG